MMEIQGSVAQPSGDYGLWLAQLSLQKKAMDGQTQAVQDLLKSMPPAESGKGRFIDVRL
jgi:hypothetical protein